jgi:branched-chain amino acid transport system ATP-binding protein
LLEIRGVSVDYGKGPVVREASIHVAQGHIVSIVGANGAGKTSLINVVSGLVPPSRGTVHFDGQDVSSVPAFQRVWQGIVQVPEGRALFPKMSVRENLLMGATCRREADIAASFSETLELFPALGNRLNQGAGSLSGGEQQMLAIARGLMAGPRLLMLDEPSLGLAPVVVTAICRLVCQLRERGMTVLIVEQNVQMSLKISDFAYVIENGVIVQEGKGHVLLEDEQLRASYFGLPAASHRRLATVPATSH